MWGRELEDASGVTISFLHWVWSPHSSYFMPKIYFFTDISQSPPSPVPKLRGGYKNLTAGSPVLHCGYEVPTVTTKHPVFPWWEKTGVPCTLG